MAGKKSVTFHPKTFPAYKTKGDQNGTKQWICWRFVLPANQGINDKDKQAIEKLWCPIQRRKCKIREVIFMEKNEESEEDFYNVEYLEEYIEDDEINSQEEGFMIGYLQ